MFSKEKMATPHEYFPYYGRGELQAIRNEHWKLVFPHRYSSLNGEPGGKGGFPVKYETNVAELALYNLDMDPSEARTSRKSIRKFLKRWFQQPMPTVMNWAINSQIQLGLN